MKVLLAHKAEARVLDKGCHLDDGALVCLEHIEAAFSLEIEALNGTSKRAIAAIFVIMGVC